MSDAAAPPFWKTRAFNAALFAASLTSVVAAFLFSMIQRFTHHRPLGAATLTVLTVIAFFALSASSARFGVGPLVARLAVLVAATLLGITMAVG